MRALRFAALIVPLLVLGMVAASGQTADELGKLRQQARQQFDTRRYAEALATQRAVAAGMERTEIARSGAAGQETAQDLASLLGMRCLRAHPLRRSMRRSARLSSPLHCGR